MPKMYRVSDVVGSVHQELDVCFRRKSVPQFKRSPWQSLSCLFVVAVMSDEKTYPRVRGCEPIKKDGTTNTEPCPLSKKLTSCGNAYKMG
jgi:hypothetical protein